jgi:alkylation response protein AidB-like acyl-CoA dehydrogenase
MDFAFSDQQEKLRQEVRRFLDAELPPEREDGPVLPDWVSDQEHYAWATAFNKKLASKGWLTAHWPTEYGGGGMSIMEQVVLREELAYRRAPLINANGVNMLGPILMIHGTDDQKSKHLPGIASVDVTWCQGYSEPDSGSDLASIQTRAVRDGDDYIINGEKTWTGHGAHAEWMFLLARTDPEAPKHKGISFFLLDMQTPGVTVEPIRSMAGPVTFTQEFFDNVRVPKENLVGEENRGWYIGATLLNFERSNISRAASERRVLDDLVSAIASGRISKGVNDDARWELADRIIETEVGRMLSYRVAAIQAAGNVPNYEASVAKVFHSELGQRIVHTGCKLLGLEGLLLEEDPRAVFRGRFSTGLMMSLLHTIGGGTSEIQRNVIATRGLTLPR